MGEWLLAPVFEVLGLFGECALLEDQQVLALTLVPELLTLGLLRKWYSHSKYYQSKESL